MWMIDMVVWIVVYFILVSNLIDSMRYCKDYCEYRYRNINGFENDVWVEIDVRIEFFFNKVFIR